MQPSRSDININDAINDYTNQKMSFISGLMPSDAVLLPTAQVFLILEKRFGDAFYKALNLSETTDSPVKNNTDAVWLKRANIVGVNVRTVQNFWNVVKYALTLPNIQNAVHLLPIWEPGVVASLYGMSSWQINPEFFSEELYVQLPHLNSSEKQLKVVINILHLMGKTVGMDVIPHTDRFSEQVLANPRCFEWLQRQDVTIVAHNNNLHETVEQVLFNFLQKKHGRDMPATAQLFFSDFISEEERCALMFGAPDDYTARLKNRITLMEHLLTFGFETVPATMGPPYRGIKVIDDTSGLVVDTDGRAWREYTITKPEKFSRVFGPLTRYKLYDNKNDNANWEIDFDKPIVATWQYVAQHYADIQKQYSFDFMRGDMAHVQMRNSDQLSALSDQLSAVSFQQNKESKAESSKLIAVRYYDILGFIKMFIVNGGSHNSQLTTHNSTPYFGSFAESFLAPDGEMAYGNEVQHLELTHADIVLGDLQSMVVGKKPFMPEWSRYLEIAKSSSVTPAFTIMTADKDDPRFDAFYLENNLFRLFFGLFFTDLPSYMGLGFEQRDKHKKPAPNEHYTKLYVFKIDAGTKATHGNYVFGKNNDLFYALNAIRIVAAREYPFLKEAHSAWIFPPDPTGRRKHVAWLISSHNTTKKLLCFANLHEKKMVMNVKFPLKDLFFLKTYFTQLDYGVFCRYNEDDGSLIVQECGPQMCFILELSE